MDPLLLLLQTAPLVVSSSSKRDATKFHAVWRYALQEVNTEGSCEVRTIGRREGQARKRAARRAGPSGAKCCGQSRPEGQASVDP